MNQAAWGKTNFGAKPRYNPLTETQKKQMSFLWACNARETVASTKRYELTCKTCRTSDIFNVSSMVADAIEGHHAGHSTWVVTMNYNKLV